jgi:preprotein translocase subunit Sec63
MTSESRNKRPSIPRGEDYYAILGVNRTATDAEIKQAYRRLALQLRNIFFLIIFVVYIIYNKQSRS